MLLLVVHGGAGWIPAAGGGSSTLGSVLGSTVFDGGTGVGCAHDGCGAHTATSAAIAMVALYASVRAGISRHLP